MSFICTTTKPRRTKDRNWRQSNFNKDEGVNA